MRTRLIIPGVLAVLSACGADRAPGSDGRPEVVVTLHPVASMVRAVAGETVRVRTLLPSGANPDGYEPSPRAVRALQGADLVVRVGGAADAWVGRSESSTVVLTDGMRLLGKNGHGTGNPHVWLDPILVRDSLVPRLTRALTELVPGSADELRRRAGTWADSLTALDAEIRALLEGVPERRFVAAHSAWPYFAARYGLEEAGVLHASPGSELGTRALAELVDEARRQGVRAVIAEPQLAGAGVEALAAELDARVAVADPVGGEGLEGRDDYLSLMRYNARAFARALGGAP